MWKKVIPVAAVLILAWIGLNLMTAKDAEESVVHAPDTATNEVKEPVEAEAEVVQLADNATADATPETAPADEEPAVVAEAVVPADEELAADTVIADDATVSDPTVAAEAAAPSGEATAEITADATAPSADADGSLVAMRYPTDPVTGASLYDQGMVEVIIEPTVEPVKEESASEQSTDTTEPAAEEVAASEPEEIVEPVMVNRVAMRYPTDPVTGATIYDQGLVEVEFESVAEPGEEIADAVPEQTADASEVAETVEGKSNTQMRYPIDPVTGATLYDQGMVEVVIGPETVDEEVSEDTADQVAVTAESAGDESKVQMRYPTDPVSGATLYDQGMVEVAIATIEGEVADENTESSSEDATETATSEVPAETAPDPATEDAADAAVIAEVAEPAPVTVTKTKTKTEAVSAIAERGTFSLGAISRTLGGVFGTTTSVLSKARDEASAQAALPGLEAASNSLNSVAGQFATLPQYAKGPLGKVIKRGMASLKPLADTALTREGVGPVLMPVMGPMLESMQAMLR